MRIQYKSKLLLALSICTAVFIAGCVDTSVQPIPSSIDYSSQIKVVNLLTNAGTATLTLNGQSLGTADLGSEIPGSQSGFLTIPSGNKILIASFQSTTDTFRFAATTDYKVRVFLVGTATSNQLITHTQRYIWQTPGSASGSSLFPADTGQVLFFNGSPDAVLNSVTFNDAIDTTTVDFDSPLALGNGSAYIKIKSGGPYTFDVLYNDSLHTTFNYSLMSKGRYTAAIYDAAANIKNAVFVDD